METSSQNALDRFISEARELCAQEPDLDKRWEALRPILTELLADPEVREASKNWLVPGHVEGRGGNLLFYEDPDYGFVINGQVHDRPRAEARNPHHHGRIYTLYGLLDGHERIVLYERTGDPSKPDNAEVRKTSDYLAGPGDIHMAKPYEIHTELSIGERTAAVIVRSAMDRGESNVGPRQIPAEMLPKKATV